MGENEMDILDYASMNKGKGLSYGVGVWVVNKIKDIKGLINVHTAHTLTVSSFRLSKDIMQPAESKSTRVATAFISKTPL